MKKLVFFTGLVLLLLITFAGCKSTDTGLSRQESATKYIEAIKQGKFTFTADRVIPRRGSSRYLTGSYSVKVADDTLDVYLPYFGRAYSAPFNPTEGGFKFVSTDFDYSVKEQKNGMYEVKIVPNDIKNADIRGTVLLFALGDNGYASLTVTSDKREPVGFSGRFE